jgi:hypothetical protein
MVARTRLIVTSQYNAFMLNNARSLNSSVGRVTRLHSAQPRHRGYIADRDNRDFSTPKWPHRPWSPPRLTLSIIQTIFTEVQQPARQANDCPLASTAVKYKCSIMFFVPYIVEQLCDVKQRNAQF